MKIATTIVLLILVGTAWGQTTQPFLVRWGESLAQQKTPAIQPAIVNNSVEILQARITALEVENMALRARIVELMASLRAVAPVAVAAAPAPNPGAQGIRKGMTEAQIQAILKFRPNSRTRREDGSMIVIWRIGGPGTFDGNGPVDRTVRVLFQNGIAVTFSDENRN